MLSTFNVSDFNSLTLLLEPWFDKPLSELPDELRQRIKQDFLPPWDALSPDQRREAALQIDYQRDPATEEDRQRGWDLTLRRERIENDIAAWEATATPTASDLAHKEARLAELNRELDQLDREERKLPNRYYPGQNNPVNSSDISSAPPSLEIGTPEWRKQNAVAAANVLHNKPGGSRDKHQQIRDIWATGKYDSRDLCAEQECAALEMSFSTARKALRNTPEP